MEFEETLSEIYTSEVKLKKEKTQFLNYSFSFGYQRILLELYDKRYTCLSFIVWIPCMPSKVPFKGFYVSFRDANIRIGRVTTDSNNFNSSCKTLI